MNKQKAARYRSIGEAHLYVAVAKADGIISRLERERAGWRAKKSQEVLDILGVNSRVEETIRADVERLLAAPEFESWTADQHLDQAVDLLKQATKLGDWGAPLSAAKHEQGLLSVARLDGYVFKESKFLREIERRLASLRG
ncbi:MAG: hypothetical protein GF418_02960 [Chitinivibrionales bacterium]|nr:hypothetical protein [Chitinivibrionales bacterium]MBD3394562.1 hypothetical protein [Chitinivibrionales bacterium]